MTPSKVAVIGAGNVAWSLAPALDALPSVEVVAVASQTLSKAEEIASRLHDAIGITVEDIPRIKADIYLISVPDSAVAKVAAQLAGSNPGAIWAHTSGTVPLETLRPLGENLGIFYPMQTFSRGSRVEMTTVPFFINSSSPSALTTLLGIANSISSMVTTVTDDERALLHAAAVIACNFTNHMWAISSEILSRKKIPFEIMRPLVMETVRKAFEAPPDKGQTGPARRGDLTTINRHASIIGDPYDKLYLSLSQSIINRFNEQD